MFLMISGFRNQFIITNAWIEKYHKKHYVIFERANMIMVAQGKSIMGAVNNLLIFLEDKEQDDLDLFVKLSK